MNKILKQLSFLTVALFLIAFSANAQSKTAKTDEMKTYVIEREIPGAGQFTQEQLKTISQTSCGVLKQMNDIQWIHSYVTGNKIYCVYKAKNEELIKEHAKRGGFPANTISEVSNVISPATAE
jgi:hypothetical protein